MLVLGAHLTPLVEGFNLNCSQRVIKPAQHSERQDDLLKLAFLESAVEQICDRPKKTYYGVKLASVVHGLNGSIKKANKLQGMTF